MKRLFKWTLIAVGVLFLIGLGASLATPQGREGLTEGMGLATGSPTIEPTATERPTPEPTERPTPEPTPSVNTDLLDALAYQTHILDTLTVVQNDLDSLTAAAQASDVDALTDAAIDLWIDAGDEVAWLDANPPAACYAEAHSTWRAVMVLYEEAGDLISDGWIYSDMTLVDEGIAAMEAGTTALTAAIEGVDSINC